MHIFCLVRKAAPLSLDTSCSWMCVQRGCYQIKNICKFAVKHDFTDLLIFKEKNHRPHGLYIVHLPGEV